MQNFYSVPALDVMDSDDDDEQSIIRLILGLTQEKPT
jgi:hypothetical protein